MKKSKKKTKTNDNSFLVYRGDSWNFSAWGARVAHQNYVKPDYRNDILGFRLAREISSLQRLAEGEVDEKIKKHNKYQ